MLVYRQGTLILYEIPTSIILYAACLLRKTYQISASLGIESDRHRFLWVIKLPESQGRFERGSFVCI